VHIAQSWLTEILQRANDGWSVAPAELDAGFVRVGLEVEGEPRTLPVITGPLTIGRVDSIEAGVRSAEQAIDSGAAHQVMERFVSRTVELAG